MFWYQFQIWKENLKQQTRKYFKTRGVGDEGGEDYNHEIKSNEPETEKDTSKTIKQPTTPKRNRRSKEMFTYDTLGKPSSYST